jgi:hypothetical protein
MKAVCASLLGGAAAAAEVEVEAVVLAPPWLGLALVPFSSWHLSRFILDPESISAEARTQAWCLLIQTEVSLSLPLPLCLSIRWFPQRFLG